MTPAPSTGQWQTVLWAMDLSGGGNWTDLAAKTGDITGDGVPEVVVGFRLVGTAHTLALDAVRRNGTAMPSVFHHGDVENYGRATVLDGHLTEYERETETTGTKYVDTCTEAGCHRGSGSPVPVWSNDEPPTDFP
jgi:hypothetical protein